MFLPAFQICGRGAIDGGSSPPPSPPGIPQNVVATAGNKFADITFNVVSGATGYNLYRDGVLFVAVGAGAGPTLTVNDEGLANGVTYSFTVSATNAGGESAQSDPATATPLDPLALIDISDPLNIASFARSVAAGFTGSGEADYQNEAAVDALRDAHYVSGVACVLLEDAPTPCALVAPGTPAVTPGVLKFSATYSAIAVTASLLRYEYRLDGAGSWTSNTTSTTLTDIAATAGDHTLNVRAVSTSGVAGAPATSASFTVSATAATMTADVWQDFEFGSDGDNPTALQLSGAHSGYTLSWSMFGTTNLNYIRTAASHPSPSTINGVTDTGTRGLEMDITGSNTASRAYYSNFSRGAAATSYNFWFRMDSTVSSVSSTNVLFQVVNSGFVGQWNLQLGTDGSGNPVIAIGGTTKSSEIALSPAAWFLVSVTAVKGGAATLHIYDDTGAEVTGSPKTVTALANDADYVALGSFNDYGAIGLVRMDNLCIDYTGTEPFKPWA